MKILMINDFGYDGAGVETYLLELKKHLGEDIEVRMFSSDHAKKSFADDYTFESHNLPQFIQFAFRLFNPIAAIKLKKVLEEYQPDIIHLHYIYDIISPSIFPILKKHPTVMTLHTQTIICPFNKYDERVGIITYDKFNRDAKRLMSPLQYHFNVLKYKLYWKYAKNIDLFLAVSNFIKKEIIRGGISNVETLPLGITLPKYVKIKDGYNLLYVGRLSHHKGIDVLIEAMPAIVKKFPQTVLRIVGRGDDKEKLQQLVLAHNLANNVTFIDFVKDNNLYRYYEECQIVIVPSVWPEPFGLVGVEAMSIGRPVIASNIGGIPEWLSDKKTGFLVEPGNADDIAEKVKKLFADKQLRETMSVNATKAAEKFSIEKHVQLLKDVYQRVTKEV